MVDMADGPVILEMNVQSIRVEVLGDHHARFNNSSLLRKICLGEGDFITGITKFLANELVLPFGGLVSTSRGSNGVDERHFERLFGECIKRFVVVLLLVTNVS